MLAPGEDISLLPWLIWKERASRAVGLHESLDTLHWSPAFPPSSTTPSPPTAAIRQLLQSFIGTHGRSAHVMSIQAHHHSSPASRSGIPTPI